MSLKNKRYLGISILFISVGLFKIYQEGIYQGDEIYWFNILIPFGMGVLFLFYALVSIMIDRKT